MKRGCTSWGFCLDNFAHHPEYRRNTQTWNILLQVFRFRGVFPMAAFVFQE